MLLDYISECIANAIDKNVDEAKTFRISVDSTYLMYL